MLYHILTSVAFFIDFPFSELIGLSLLINPSEGKQTDQTSSLRLLETMDLINDDRQDPRERWPQSADKRPVIQIFRGDKQNAQLRIESARSGGSSLIAVMKPTDFWNRDDPALVGGWTSLGSGEFLFSARWQRLS